MRFAVTGTHGSGKSTLVDDFVASYGHYQSVGEPYWQLVQQGVVFADGPNIADLEDQLRQSCELISGTEGKDLVFDRCPLDLIAYLDVVAAAEGTEWMPDGKLLGRIGRALSLLDLIVFVPLKVPDEITVAIEYPKLRRRVDARLKTILRDDDLGLLANGPSVVEVTGTRSERVAQLAGLGA